MARPSSYTIEIANEICQRIAEDESLISICKDKHMPTRQTVHNWIFNWKKNPVYTDFFDNYCRARDLQPESTYEKLPNLEEQILSGEVNPQAGRVVIDSMHWRMGKRKPKIYGDIKQIDGHIGVDINIKSLPKPVGAGTSTVGHAPPKQLTE